jgi:hypothetical protein
LVVPSPQIELDLMQRGRGAVPRDMLSCAFGMRSSWPITRKHFALCAELPLGWPKPGPSRLFAVWPFLVTHPID